MAINQLAPNTAAQPTIPAGKYGGGNGSARILKAETRTLTIRKDTPKAEDIEFIDISVLVRTVEDMDGNSKSQIVNTSPFNDNTRTTPNTGSKAEKFLKQLGFPDPVGQGFDLDSLADAEVVVEVAYQLGKDGVARNWVKDIAKL